MIPDLHGGASRAPLKAAPLVRALTMPGFGPAAWRSLELVAVTGSTNADLMVRAQAGEAHGLVLIADHQESGRGRLDRSWVAPPRAGLAMSVLLRPTTGSGEPIPITRWVWLSLIAGLAVADAMRSSGLEASVKWPNDVLVPTGSGERAHGGGPGEELGKICGILAEVARSGSAAAVVLGAGINVSQQQDELPIPTATSMVLAGAAVTDRSAVAQAYLQALADRYQRWCAADGDVVSSGLIQDYRRASCTIGTQVRVHLPGGAELLGLARDIDEQGRLLVLEQGATEPVAVSVGDVVHVRRAG